MSRPTSRSTAPAATRSRAAASRCSSASRPPTSPRSWGCRCCGCARSCASSASRCRERAAVTARDELQGILTELVTVSSAAEAERLAEQLRQRGILAIANVAPWPKADEPAHVLRGDTLRAFVVVARRDLERAQAELYAMHTPEGDATHEEIEAALAGTAGDELGTPSNGTLSRLQRVGDTLSPWLGRLVVLALAGVVAW